MASVICIRPTAILTDFSMYPPKPRYSVPVVELEIDDTSTYNDMTVSQLRTLARERHIILSRKVLTKKAIIQTLIATDSK